MSKEYNKSLFQGVPKKNVQKSRFDMSHEWKNQISLSRLTPFFLQETMPNDEWEINTEFMFRMQSLYYPIMHKLTMRADYFYIPNGILWTYQGPSEQGWRKWIQLQTEEAVPTFTAQMKYDSAALNHMILQYMGIPLINHATLNTIPNLSALPLSAYLKVYDEYYRVPQVEAERWFPLVKGDNTSKFDTVFGGTSGRYNTFAALWEKDYFTSALPTPQIGEEITIPMLTDQGPPYNEQHVMVASDGTEGWNSGLKGTNVGSDTILTSDAGVPVVIDTSPTAAAIRQLRIAETLQSFYERIMKIGQRYSDYIFGLFGNEPQPGIIDVPVLLGSKFGRVQISDVLTTAETVNGTVVSVTGDYRGNANLYSADNDTIRYHCPEHGWILGVLQVNPNTNYGQGIHRMWRRTIQTDYPLDMFSSIGDQEILKEELVYNYLDTSTNGETFGYIPQHSEMKYANNIFQGLLQIGDNKSQHLGRLWDIATLDFDQLVINESFVHAILNGTQGGVRATDVFRVLPIIGTGAPQQHAIFAHIFHSAYVNRCLPYYAVPDLT